MPARQSKQTAKKTTKQAAAKTSKTKAPKVAKATAIAAGRTQRKAPKVKASWTPVSQATKNYVLRTFDTGVKFVMHKIPDDKYTEVHDALISARNQVAASLETSKVPPSKRDYDHLSATLVNLKDTKQQLEQRYATLTNTLHEHQREMQTLQEEKEYLQDFGQVPAKHHPLLLESMEKELHLNFDTVR